MIERVILIPGHCWGHWVLAGGYCVHNYVTFFFNKGFQTCTTSHILTILLLCVIFLLVGGYIVIKRLRIKIHEICDALECHTRI